MELPPSSAEMGGRSDSQPPIGTLLPAHECVRARLALVLRWGASLRRAGAAATLFLCRQLKITTRTCQAHISCCGTKKIKSPASIRERERER